MLRALQGALGFLTRFPVGSDERAWDAFRTTPAAFPAAGAVVGAIAAVPLALIPGEAGVVGYLGVLYLSTGVAHVDGLADLGDATAAHGTGDRRQALKDVTVGAGGTLAVCLVVVGLAVGCLALADVGWQRAAAVVIAAEVGAKAGMATLAVRSRPLHEGLGSAVLGGAEGASLLPLVGAAGVVVGLTPAAIRPATATGLLVGVAVSLLVGRWATSVLGGVNGDVLGAANELARVAGVTGGIAWTLW